MEQILTHCFVQYLIAEFEIPDTTYKNPIIVTIYHTLHKGTLNNCHSTFKTTKNNAKTNRKKKQNTATFFFPPHPTPDPEPHKNMIQYMPISHKTHL